MSPPKYLGNSNKERRQTFSLFHPSQKNTLADSAYGLFVNKQTEVWKLVTDQLGFCSCSWCLGWLLFFLIREDYGKRVRGSSFVYALFASVCGYWYEKLPSPEHLDKKTPKL